MAATLLAATGGLARSAQKSAASCGYERWNVKVLLDPAASRIDFAPRAVTVAELRALPRPPRIGPNAARTAPAEFRVYALNVRLVAVRRTPSYDTLLVVEQGKPANTIIIGFPDTHLCLPNPGVNGGDIHSATDGLNADCGPSIPSDHWQRLSGTATVNGVGFFEPPHAPIKWMAPNGLTLHPSLEFYSPNCKQIDAGP